MRNILYPAGKATYIDKREPVVEEGLSASNEKSDAEKLMVKKEKMIIESERPRGTA